MRELTIVLGGGAHVGYPPHLYFLLDERNCGMNMFPKVQDLTAVRNGKGYITGKLTYRHDVFRYLREDTLCLITNSVGAVFRAAEELGWKPRRNKSSDDENSGEFQQFKNLQDAMDTFKNNPRSIRKFKEADDDLKAEDNIGRDINFNVTGDFLDISRFLEDDPECFGVAVNGNPSSLRINIIYNANAVSYVTREALNHKQARLLELVDWFESRNVRCRIVSFASTQCAHMEILIKGFEDSVNMNDIAIVGHSDFLRRVCFLVDEQSDNWESGYGTPRHFSEVMSQKYVADADDGLTIYIDDQSTSNIEDINLAFDNTKQKVADVISSPEKRDFSRVYMVQL